MTPELTELCDGLKSGWQLQAAREICGTLAEIDSMKSGHGPYGGEVYRDGMCDDMPEVQRAREILAQLCPDGPAAASAIEAMAGRVGEREAVVAWLRDKDLRKPNHYQTIADAIERGEHRGEGKG